MQGCVQYIPSSVAGKVTMLNSAVLFVVVLSPQWRAQLQSLSLSFNQLWSASQSVGGWEVIYRPVFCALSFSGETLPKTSFLLDHVGFFL